MTVLLKDHQAFVFDNGIYAGRFYLVTNGIDWQPSIGHPVNPDFDTWYQAFRLLEG